MNQVNCSDPVMIILTSILPTFLQLHPITLSIAVATGSVPSVPRTLVGHQFSQRLTDPFFQSEFLQESNVDCIMIMTPHSDIQVEDFSSPQESNNYKKKIPISVQAEWKRTSGPSSRQTCPGREMSNKDMQRLENVRLTLGVGKE